MPTTLFVGRRTNRCQVRYNQPAGHLEANESLIEACIREVQEECGLTIRPTHLVGIYQYSATAELAFLRFTFAVTLEHMPTAIPLDPKIKATHWLTIDEIEALTPQLRSPLVLTSLHDYCQGHGTNLSLINSDFLTR